MRYLSIFAVMAAGVTHAAEPLPLSAPPAAPLIAQVSPRPAGPTFVGEPATTSPVRGTVRPVSTSGLCLCGENCGCCATVEAKLAEMQRRLDAWEAFGVEYRQWVRRSGVQFAKATMPANRAGTPTAVPSRSLSAPLFYSQPMYGGCPGGVCQPQSYGWRFFSR